MGIAALPLLLAIGVLAYFIFRDADGVVRM